MVHLKTTTVDLNINQVYAPTCQYDDELIENFHAELKQISSPTKSQDVTIVVIHVKSKIREKYKEG